MPWLLCAERMSSTKIAGKFRGWAEKNYLHRLASTVTPARQRGVEVTASHLAPLKGIRSLRPPSQRVECDRRRNRIVHRNQIRQSVEMTAGFFLLQAAYGNAKARADPDAVEPDQPLDFRLRANDRFEVCNGALFIMKTASSPRNTCASSYLFNSTTLTDCAPPSVLLNPAQRLAFPYKPRTATGWPP